MEFKIGFALPLRGDDDVVVEVYDFEPRRGDQWMGRWILRDER